MTMTESQACVPNTGEANHNKRTKQENSISRQNKRTPSQGKTRELHLKAKQENSISRSNQESNDINKSASLELK
ncbi:hypothetical protein BgiBS90_033201 [Biomphalaria glabrata]|nr:hypothetical protein BgiBS90_033201 [Biomphalaria glabrata]